jgi:hypothetical protein
MSSGQAAAFQTTADAAQRAAGVVASRHRGDFEGAEILLAGLDDHTRAAGCLFLADLAIALLAKVEGRSVDEVAAELSLQVAAFTPAAEG